MPDLDGLELVGDHAEAVLIGGCDETLEPNQVFSYMNLARAFAEIQMGASLYCLHKNKWWQTSRGPMLDSGALRRGPRVRDGRRGDRPRQAEPRRTSPPLSTPRRGARADLARHRRRRARTSVRARLFGMKTALVRTGKFRPEALEAAETSPDIVVSARSAHFPALLEEDLHGRMGAVKVGVDIIEIERIERALERPGFRERCFTRCRAGVLRLAPRPGAELRRVGSAGKEAVGKALGCGVRFTWKEIEIVGRPKPGVRLSGERRPIAERSAGGADRPVDDALARDRGRDRRREPAPRGLMWARGTHTDGGLRTAHRVRRVTRRYPRYRRAPRRTAAWRMPSRRTPNPIIRPLDG